MGKARIVMHLSPALRTPTFTLFRCRSGDVSAFGLLLVALVPLMALPVGAAAPDADAVAFFERKIRPVLVEHCYACHSTAAAEAKKLQAGLFLDSRAGVRRGGESGPAVVPGDPDASLVISALRHEALEMPPSGKLPDQVIADFVRWVNSGAGDPRTGDAPRAATRDENLKGTHWAFAPPQEPAIPAVRDAAWPRNEIDHFILARLEASGIQPVPRADRRTLVRRAYFDLIGLPPAPEEAGQFLDDDSPEAYEKLVDRLLASKHFGERWGRHWMDVARYADSVGGGGNFVFDNAWRYRDWIIRSLNDDKPYDRFIIEQIAGDLLPADTPQQKSRQIIATGFLAIGRKELPEYDKAKLTLDVVDEQIDTLGKAFLGLSLGCARCHDHKFDPVSLHDYYALAGIFESTETLTGRTGGPHSNWLKVDLPDKSGQAIAVRDRAKKIDGRICIRGDAHRRTDAVPRGVIAALAAGDPPAIGPAQSGRLELARWIAGPEHPLTARVAVNRIWHWLFGTGLVRTTDNFGVRGEPPTHPKLLDHLAVRFVEDGWSVKQTIRRIMLSQTYQLSSGHDPQAAAKDPENHLLWRHNRRRLEAEVLRDALLAVSGQLDRTQYGKTLTFTGRLDEAQEKKLDADPWRRRSVYLPRYREDKQIDILEMFDAAHPALVTGNRRVTAVPTQALLLLNSPLLREQATRLAQRVLAKQELGPSQKVDFAYQLAFARPATPAEIEQDLQFVEAAEAALRSEAPKSGDSKGEQASSNANTQAWAMFCHSLLASNEFLFVD